MKVWVITGKSESGDDYGPVVYKRKPSDKKLSELAHTWDGKYKWADPNFYEEGPGAYGSYVDLSISKCEVQ